MAHPFEHTAISSSTDFQMHSRPKNPGESQASETYLVTATGERPLGRNGALNGVAKRDLTDYQADLNAEYLKAKNAFMETLVAYKSELESQRVEGMTEEETKALNSRLEYMDKVIAKPSLVAPFDLGSKLPGPEVRMAYTAFNQAQEHTGLTQGTVSAASSLMSPENRGDMNKMHLLSRAVASSTVDQALKINVLAEEKFGQDANGRPIGISVMVDGAGVTGNLGEGSAYVLKTDYSHPETQKGLYDLECLDYLTGQIDRHPGNVFVDPATGKVMGIDNDLAFPQMNRGAMLSDANNEEMVNKPVANLPRYMHEDTARKIESMRPDDLRRTLANVKPPGGGDGLTTQEIDGAVDRLKELQKHAADLRKTGRVVKEFNKHTYDEAINHQKIELTVKNPGTFYDTADTQALQRTPKTSYIGSVAIAEKVNALGRSKGAKALTIDEYMVSEQRQGKCLTSPKLTEYSKQSQAALATCRSEAEGPRKAELRKMETELKALDTQISRLETNNLSKFKAVFSGGAKDNRNKAVDERLELLQKINDIEKQIDASAAVKLESQKPQLFSNASAKFASDTSRMERMTQPSTTNGFRTGDVLSKESRMGRKMENAVENYNVQQVASQDSGKKSVRDMYKVQARPVIAEHRAAVRV